MVGVGPGDPELITVAAQRAIAAATVVAYPVAALERPGMAAQIAQPWLASTQRRLPLLFPMVQEAEPRQQAWQQAASAVAAEVAAGEQVVFLCEGDCSLFASSSYLLLALKKEAPELPVRVIPGITAASAAAAVACWPLALQEQPYSPSIYTHGIARIPRKRLKDILADGLSQTQYICRVVQAEKWRLILHYVSSSLYKYLVLPFL